MGRLDPPGLSGKARRPDQAVLKGRIQEICATRVRYGYRRVQVLLRREGCAVNHKRTRRIYSELGLQLLNKTPKRRVKAKLRDDRAPALRPNDVWAMDSVHDQLATGRKIRVLTVVDTFSQFSPAVEPRFSYRAEDVVATLERVCAEVGYPRTIRVDQARSSSRAISPCGPTRGASRWTSRGRANRRTTHSSRPSTGASAASA